LYKPETALRRAKEWRKAKVEIISKPGDALNRLFWGFSFSPSPHPFSKPSTLTPMSLTFFPAIVNIEDFFLTEVSGLKIS
jgi:hypothetical protein